MSRLMAMVVAVLLAFPSGLCAQKAAKGKIPAVKSVESQDDIITEIVDLSASAYQFRRLASDKGGGGGSYEKFRIGKKGPKGVKILKAAADSIVFRKGSVEAVLDSAGNVKFK